MKIAASLTLACLLALGGCDEPKSRTTPFDPMAAGPPPEAPSAAPGAGMSIGLPKRPQAPGFFLDHVGGAADPLGRPPAVTAGDQPMLFDGFGFDPVAKAPGKGVDLVVDGRVYAAVYGAQRPDVAQFHKTPGLVAVGYKATLPAGTLKAGPHSVAVRVIAADGAGYYEGPPVPFTVK